MEPKLLRPDADHAPSIEENDSNGYSVEHSLCGKAETFLDGIEMARESVDSGRAMQKLQAMAAFTNARVV